jgi:hypothetical protein
MIMICGQPPTEFKQWAWKRKGKKGIDLPVRQVKTGLGTYRLWKTRLVDHS